MKRMRKMKKLALLMFGLLMLLPYRALAYDEVEVEIPVTTNESCVIQMSGDFNEEQTIDGSGAFIVPVSHPGTYNCRIQQIPGDEESKIYDEQVYNVLIFVETADGKLQASIILSADGEPEKLAELAFENETVPLPSPPDEPDEPDGPATPEEPDTPDTPEEPEKPDTPDTPDEPSNPTKSQHHRAQHNNNDTPRTGDTNAVLIWSVVMLVSAALLAMVLIIWRNRRRRK